MKYELEVETIEATFNTIYKEHRWGKNFCSGEGARGIQAKNYVDFVLNFIKSNNIASITDIGCGDFYIGSQLSPHVKNYFALDVSEVILNIVKNKYDNLKNVQFSKRNACIDTLPSSDLVTIKQVLQHLMNRQVEQILKNLERSKFKYALITEHILSNNKKFKPNLDLLFQQGYTRTSYGSCLMLAEPPFNRPVTNIYSYSIPNLPDENISIFLWKF